MPLLLSEWCCKSIWVTEEIHRGKTYWKQLNTKRSFLDREIPEPQTMLGWANLSACPTFVLYSTLLLLVIVREKIRLNILGLDWKYSVRFLFVMLLAFKQPGKKLTQNKSMQSKSPRDTWIRGWGNTSRDPYQSLQCKDDFKVNFNRSWQECSTMHAFSIALHQISLSF